MNIALPQHNVISHRMGNGVRLLPMKLLELLAMALLVVAGGSFLAGLLVLAFQAKFWSDHGIWQPITVLAGVYGLLPAPFLDWVFDPREWVTLAGAVEHFLSWSVWWVLMLFSLAILYGALAMDKLSHRRQFQYYRTRRNQALEGESE